VVFGVMATFFLLVSFRNVKENIRITEERMTLKRGSACAPIVPGWSSR
jgi:hypothetical protein